MWVALAVMVGIAEYLVKYKVQALEVEVVATRDQAARDHSAIRVLDAEWTYLNDPERLRRLSAQHLHFGPPVPQNVTDIAGLPMRGAPGGTTGTAPATTAAPPADPAKPTIDAEAAPVAPAVFQRPAGLPVFIARLQRLLLPDAVGATTSLTRKP
jgi:hypothetical protein